MKTNLCKVAIGFNLLPVDLKYSYLSFFFIKTKKEKNNFDQNAFG